MNTSEPQEYAAVKVSKLGGELAGKLIQYDALVVGVKRGRARIKTAFYVCGMCDEPHEQELQEYGEYYPAKVCESCKRPALKLNLEKCKLQDILEIRVQELPQHEEHRRVEVKHPHLVICDSDKAPAELGGALTICGKLAATPTDGKQEKKSNPIYGFYTLAHKITASRDAFLDYEPTAEDLLAFQEHFATPMYDILLARTNGTIAPYIYGRELAKLAVDIALHSNLNNRCNLAMPGDSRTGKSEILLDMAQNLTPAGTDYVACESASRTGISYTIDTSGPEPELRFGALAACDMTALGLDAINALHPEEQKELREAISQGKIKVNRLLKGEALARVRIIAALNLPKDRKVASYATRSQAAIESFYSTIDRNRYDFVIVFGENDVSKDDIDKAEERRKDASAERSIPADIYQKHLCYCWQQHAIEWESGVWASLIVELRKIRATIGPVPLLANDFTKFAGNWCIAVAQRCHSFDKGAVIVKQEHVNIFAELVQAWLEDLEIEKARKLWADVSEIDVPRLIETIKDAPNQLALIKCLAKGLKRNSDIGEALALTRPQVSQTGGRLEELKVIEKRSEGYFLTPIGLRVANGLLGKLSTEEGG
jgi:hypothetical protein